MLDPWTGTDTPGGQYDIPGGPKNEGDSHPVMSNPGEIIGYDANGNPIRGSKPGNGNSSGGPGPGGGGSPFGGSGAASGTGTGTGSAAGVAEATPVTGEAASAAAQGVTQTPWWQSLLGTAGGNSSSLLKWIQFAANVYQSQKKGTFQQPPMSPEQKQMFDWAMNQLQSMPSNVGAVKPLLQYDIAHPATIDMAAIRAGKVGYTPNGHMPGADVAAMLRASTSVGGTGTGTGTGTVPGMPPPTDINGNNPFAPQP